MTDFSFKIKENCWEKKPEKKLREVGGFCIYYYFFFQIASNSIYKKIDILGKTAFSS